jgi:predicted heme/steroid binding protein
VLLLVLSSASDVHSIEEYADLTGQECTVCHLSESGGGGLTPAGEQYVEDPDSWIPPARGVVKTTLAFRIVHLLTLYLHILFSIVWIGTILYVHLVLKPKYAIGGLPRSELRLAWISMPIIAVTGILLTIYRLRATPDLFQTFFGKVLLGKIGIFLLMISSATFVTLFVGPRLRKIAESHPHVDSMEGKEEYTNEELLDFNGEDQSKTLVAVNEQVWDLTDSRLWKNGLHAGRHKAGRDLTEYMAQAPHGLEVLAKYKKIGRLTTSARKVPVIIKIFTVNAHFNLVGCFVIILLLALWRW